LTNTNDIATDNSDPKLAAVPLALLAVLSIFEHRNMHSKGNTMLKNGSKAVGTAFGFIGYRSLYNKLSLRNFSYGSENSNAKPMDNKTKRSAASNAMRYRTFKMSDILLLFRMGFVVPRVVFLSTTVTLSSSFPLNISKDTNDDEFRRVLFVNE